MKIKGSMTIAMSLLLSVIMSLFISGIHLSQIQCERVQAVNAVDTGLYSVFSEYDKELLENYELFFLDSSYGKGEVNCDSVAAQMGRFLDKGLCTGLTRCTTQSCKVTKYRLATDDSGLAFKKQAVRAAKNSVGIDTLNKIGDSIQSATELVQSQMEQKEAGPPPVETDESLSENIPADNFPQGNPLDTIRKIQSMGILGLVLPADMEPSPKAVNTSVFLSHRGLQRGKGNLGKAESDKINTLWFQTYVMDKMSNFSKNQKDNVLDYQLEYILGGKSSDKENLKRTVNRLLLMREAANTAYLYTDTRKRSEAAALAASICTLFLVPEGTQVVEGILLLGWAYAESLLDVRQLLLGGKVPAVKTEEHWQLDLARIGDIFSMLQSDEVKTRTGLSYEDYLRILLCTASEYNVTFRCMDMIEQEIRNKTGNTGFRMDSCVESLEIETVIQGGAASPWSICRTYGYDM